jgi:hypothetical protein
MKAFLASALVLAWPCTAIAQIAVLQIKIVDGDGAVHSPGARVVRPLTVEVLDESGKAAGGAAVSFQLPPDGPSGLFSNGLRTDLVLTDASGRASLHSMQLNRTAGQFRIRITAVKESSRAGAVSTQYIGEGHNALPVPATPSPLKPSEVQPNETAALQAGVQPTPPAPPRATPKSGEITPTTSKMGSGIHKKWIILAVILAAGAGGAFAGISHGSSSSANSGTVASSVVSIGTPVITIGHP